MLFGASCFTTMKMGKKWKIIRFTTRYTVSSSSLVYHRGGSRLESTGRYGVPLMPHSFRRRQMVVQTWLYSVEMWNGSRCPGGMTNVLLMHAVVWRKWMVRWTYCYP